MYSLKLLSIIFLSLLVIYCTQYTMNLNTETFHSFLEMKGLRTLGMTPTPNEINESADFKQIVINALVITGHSLTIPITIHQITAFNKHLVPPFERINIEFFSLSQSLWFQRRQFSLAQYHQMLQRVSALSKQYEVVTINDKEPILNAIVREFGNRHSMKLLVASTRLFTTTNGLRIHIDPVHSHGCPEMFCLKLWIPLTSTEIDNLCLGVGDVSDLKDPQCAIPSIKQTQRRCSGFEFNRVRWYQYTRMTNEDWILFQGDRVPHFSANLGHTQITQERVALVVHIKFMDMN